MQAEAVVNVDPSELEKFAQLAARWWDADGPSRPLHDLNPERLAYVRERRTLAGARALDVGCGGGLLSEALALAGADALGIDLTDALLEVASLHRHEQAFPASAKLEYRNIAVEDLARETPGSFDAITCMEMLEHVPDPASVIVACATLLKPGGDLFLSTLNRTPKAFALAILGAALFIHHQRIDQGLQAAHTGFDAVFHAHQRALRDACVFRVFAGKAPQQAAKFVGGEQPLRE